MALGFLLIFGSTKSERVAFPFSVTSFVASNLFRLAIFASRFGCGLGSISCTWAYIFWMNILYAINSLLYLHRFWHCYWKDHYYQNRVHWRVWNWGKRQYEVVVVVPPLQNVYLDFARKPKEQNLAYLNLLKHASFKCMNSSKINAYIPAGFFSLLSPTNRVRLYSSVPKINGKGRSV